MTFAIAGFYFSYFGALGIFLPYFSLWLVAQGLTPAQATRMLGLLPLMSLVAPPLFGLWADARRARGWLLRAGTLGAAVAFAACLGAERRTALVGAVVLFALCRSPLVSLVDAATLDHIRQHGGSYGRLRLWGSLGFLLAAAGGGLLLERAGLRTLLRVGVAAMGLCAAWTFVLPAPPPKERHGVVGAWVALLRDGRWWRFLLAVALAQTATASYDSAFTLHLGRLGYSGRFIGIAWATGVLSEICFMALSGRILGRLGAARLFAASLATAALRWACLSRAQGAVAILALQPLHGITFGLFWVAAVTLVRARGQAAPTAAQGLFAAALGVGAVIGMNLAGRLLELGGGRLLYGAAAAVAAMAAAVALLNARDDGSAGGVR